MVKKIQAELVSINDRGNDVYTLEFRPEGRSVRFSPGQFLHLALDAYDPSSGWPESRCFSLQSSPDEATIRLTYAVKGVFTRRMADELRQGAVVSLKIPYGELFTQAHSRHRAQFLAGGTGITPFLSLFTDRSFQTYTQTRLFFGVRTEEHDFYRLELRRAKEINPEFEIRRYVQDRDGLIDGDEVLRRGDEESCYFISGPPKMIAYFREYLAGNGVAPDRVKTDDWE